jgi:acyl-coenzyme A thioesterase PaaI-like protein
MTARVLNHEWEAANHCLGCGPGNTEGLRVEVARDPSDPGRLSGRFVPRDTMNGFPGIVHGGALYIALDCMATWSGMVLKGTRAVWVLRSASVTYHRPAPAGRPVSLFATIEEEGGEWDAIRVRCEAKNEDGALLVDGSFKAIPLSADRFMTLTGTDRLPPGWSDWLAGEGAPFPMSAGV